MQEIAEKLLTEIYNLPRNPTKKELNEVLKNIKDELEAYMDKNFKWEVTMEDIGQMCRFWDDNDKEPIYGRLSFINRKEKLYECSHLLSFKHCKRITGGQWGND